MLNVMKTYRVHVDGIYLTYKLVTALHGLVNKSTSKVSSIGPSAQ